MMGGCTRARRPGIFLLQPNNTKTCTKKKKPLFNSHLGALLHKTGNPPPPLITLPVVVVLRFG